MSRRTCSEFLGDTSGRRPHVLIPGVPDPLDLQAEGSVMTCPSQSHRGNQNDRRTFLKTAVAAGSAVRSPRPNPRRPSSLRRPRVGRRRSPPRRSARRGARSASSAWGQAGSSRRASSRPPCSPASATSTRPRSYENTVSEKVLGDVLERTKTAQGRLPRHQERRLPQGNGRGRLEDAGEPPRRQLATPQDRLRRQLLPARRRRRSDRDAPRPGRQGGVRGAEAERQDPVLRPELPRRPAPRDPRPRRPRPAGWIR